MEDIRYQREQGTKKLVKISKLWHNSFKDLFQINQDANIFLKKFFPNSELQVERGAEKTEGFITSIIMRGFQQATDLTSLAKTLKIPINPEFDKLVMLENAPKIIKLKDFTFRILGPTKKNLD